MSTNINEPINAAEPVTEPPPTPPANTHTIRGFVPHDTDLKDVSFSRDFPFVTIDGKKSINVFKFKGEAKNWGTEWPVKEVEITIKEVNHGLPPKM